MPLKSRVTGVMKTEEWIQNPVKWTGNQFNGLSLVQPCSTLPFPSLCPDRGDRLCTVSFFDREQWLAQAPALLDSCRGMEGVVVTLNNRKIMKINLLDDAVLSRRQWHFHKLPWIYMISHLAYQRVCGTHFGLGEMTINNELKELIQIQSI